MCKRFDLSNTRGMRTDAPNDATPHDDRFLMQHCPKPRPCPSHFVKAVSPPLTARLPLSPVRQPTPLASSSFVEGKIVYREKLEQILRVSRTDYNLECPSISTSACVPSQDFPKSNRGAESKERCNKFRQTAIGAFAWMPEGDSDFPFSLGIDGFSAKPSLIRSAKPV